MSGTALGFEAARMSKTTYEDVVQRAKKFVKNAHDITRNIKAEEIPAYMGKESFGDADILLMCSEVEWEGLCATVQNTFTHHKRNGSVISFGMYGDTGEIHQVDLIYGGNNGTDFWCAYDYYAWNDLGNLVGRIADRLGFKYGHDGLRYIIRDPEHETQVICDLNISKDSTWIHEFLGFQVDGKFAVMSFETKEDIFKYVASSTYFHPDIFLLENRNYKARVRDAKRTTYMEFLEWCKNNDFQNVIEIDSSDLFRIRAYKLGEGLRSAGLATMIAYHDAQLLHGKRMFSKFLLNGKLVSGWTGKTGVELGQQMQTIRNSLNDDQIIALGSRVKETVLSILERK